MGTAIRRLRQHVAPQSDSGGFDWAAIGTVIVAVVGGIAGALKLRRNGPPSEPGSSAKAVANEEPAIAALRSALVGLQDENKRLWQRNQEQDVRYDLLDERCEKSEQAVRELRGAVARLRDKLIRASIDPGE